MRLPNNFHNNNPSRKRRKRKRRIRRRRGWRTRSTSRRRDARSSCKLLQSAGTSGWPRCSRGGGRGAAGAQARSFIRRRRVGGAGGEGVPCLDCGWLLGEKKQEREKRRRRGRRESERGRRRSEGGRGGGGRGREGGGGGVVAAAVAARWLCFSCWLLFCWGQRSAVA
uniref:Uncharacterized protein n=1 Tax=Pipistrellus kuhlii TaxID=59472 RepID=A0A7J7W2Y8_PIPKU|nr:hypothetical protein mPipKuh1_008144 [Pipistrellus kuhlii]